MKAKKVTPITPQGFFHTHGPKLFKRGYDVIPIKPGGKYPGMNGWQKKDFKPFLNGKGGGKYAGYGLGIRTGKTVGVDIDVLDAEISEEMLDIVSMVIDADAPIRIGKAPKTLLVCRADKPFKKKTSKRYVDADEVSHRVEILGDGQQFLAHAIHPDTNEPYAWPDGDLMGLKWADLPLLTSKQADQIIAEYEALVAAKRPDWKLDKKESKPKSEKTSSKYIDFDPQRLNVDMARGAIKHLNYDDRDCWLKVGMCLHHTQDKRAFKLWDIWSSQSTLYKEGECEKLWEGFSINRDGGVVTMKHLYADALEAGWEGGIKNGTTGLLNQSYAFVMIEGIDYIMNIHSFDISKVSSIRNKLANVAAYDANGEPIAKYNKQGDMTTHYRAFDIWLRSPIRNSFDRVVFKPNPATVKPNEFNLWQGMSVEPKAGDCDLIIQHILKVWCRDDDLVFDYVIKWMAQMCQVPWKQAGSAITLRSTEGAGKDSITGIFERVFAKHHFKASKHEDITGRFNSLLAMSIFVVLNEAVWGGKKQDEGVLKMLITDPTFSVEKKFVEVFIVPNCTHLIISSNREWVAPIGKGDRRYLNLELSEEYVSDWKYFDALHDQIDNGGCEAFLAMLLAVDLSKFRVADMPYVDNTNRTVLKLAGMESHEQWWIDVVDNGGLVDSQSLSRHFDGWDAGEVTIDAEDMRGDYEAYCRKRGGYPKSSTAMGIFLLQEVDFKKTRAGSGRRQWQYVLPCRMDCMTAIDDLMLGDSPFSDEIAENDG